MKHNSVEQLDILAFISEDDSKFDIAYINSRIVSESIVTEIVRSLRLLDKKDHRNQVLFLRNIDQNKSFGVLCGLAPSILGSYETICVETSPGRHLIIKGSHDRIGKFYESSRA